MKALQFGLIVLTLLAIPFMTQAQSKPEIEYVNSVFFPATTLLYSEAADGGMRMRCTATAIEKTKTGYIFVTAAHCGAQDDWDTRTVSPEKTFFYITEDSINNKLFLKAEPVGAGYRPKGDDFMLFSVTTTQNFPIVALGHDPVAMEPVVSVQSPLGLGKQVLVGSVSKAFMDRPIVQENEDIDWTGAVAIQLAGTDGGSSGSAVVCLDQKAVCAIFTGTMNKTTMIAMPVSRLKKFMEELKNGSYKYWLKNPN